MFKSTRSKAMIIDGRKTERPDIRRMDENDIIVVNRIRLNTKLVEYEIKKMDVSTVRIISDAIRLSEKDSIKNNRYNAGVKMKVGDVKKVFPDYDNLPLNSFAFANK